MANTSQNVNHLNQRIQDLCEDLEKAKNDFVNARNNYNKLSTKVRRHPNFDSKKHGDCFNNLTRDGGTKAYAAERAGNMAHDAKKMAYDAKNIISSFFNKGNKVPPTPSGQQLPGQ